MEIRQTLVTQEAVTADFIQQCQQINAQVILIFAHDLALASSCYTQLRQALPNSHILGCSTSLSVLSQGLNRQGAAITAISFSHVKVQLAQQEASANSDSVIAGIRLARSLAAEDLQAVLILSPMTGFTIQTVVTTLQQHLAPDVKVYGGIAESVNNNWVISDAGVSEQQVVALGLYGPELKQTTLRVTGWRAFGPLRKITSASENTLYELDGKSALELYKEYLGEYAAGLPATGDLFPFEVRSGLTAEDRIIRSIVDIDEAKGGIIMAGDIDPNGYAQLMYAQTDTLLDEVEWQMQQYPLPDNVNTTLAIFISCYGRNQVMANRVDEELEMVMNSFPLSLQYTGFYSNGEIAAQNNSNKSRVCNQTLVVVQLSEEPYDHQTPASCTPT